MFGRCSKLSGELIDRWPSVTLFSGWQQDINRIFKEHVASIMNQGVVEMVDRST